MIVKNKNLPKTTAIIVAAGTSTRMASSPDTSDIIDKIFAPINGKPVLLWSLEAFQNTESVDEIIVVTRLESINKIREFKVPKVINIVSGGTNRAQSVLCGLNEITHNEGIVAVHDGARPMVTPVLIDKVISAAITHKAAIPAIAIRDTVKVACDGFVQSTLDRNMLYAAQTPQAFDLQLYREIIKSQNTPESSAVAATDDSMLAEQLGIKVKIVEGDSRNIKITVQEDLVITQAFKNQERTNRHAADFI